MNAKEKPRVLGAWKNFGVCNPITPNSSCGPGVQEQKRSCIDGVGSDVCLPDDTMQIISCKQAGTDLPDCPKILGSWYLDGGCIATKEYSSCGPGTQKLKRTCQNGTGSAICKYTDMNKIVPCVEVGSELRNCPKVYGPWINSGSCIANMEHWNIEHKESDMKCGPGTQKQTRNCTDGTGSEICIEEDTFQFISCRSAGSDLPDCPKTFGQWENKGTCQPVSNSTKDCGPGMQYRERKCTDGTGQLLCDKKDTSEYISCQDAGTSLPHCQKLLGPWENIGPCIPAASNSSCGTGVQRQIRTCKDGTGPNICQSSDQERSLSCEDTGTKLPDCSKVFGNWENEGNCIASGQDKSCGPGTQKQKRVCGDGTGAEICNINDTRRVVPCDRTNTSLPDCLKNLGPWKNVGNCIAENVSCGDGLQKQERLCVNGTGSEVCQAEDVIHFITCKEAGTDLPECPKTFGVWKNSGPCLPIASITDCGPGIQVQERSCLNGTGLEICRDEDMVQEISCKAAGTDLPDCAKQYGEWTNVGKCVGNMSCGNGYQKQKRTCIDGTGSEICKSDDLIQTISCEKAGVQLPDCPKILGSWKNQEACVASGSNPFCGPGTQLQKRDCVNGTGSEICTEEDKVQTISCKESGTELPDCPKVFGSWENEGYCIAIGSNPFCGPGLQTQRRTCTNGTGQQICSPVDRVRRISCLEAGTPLPMCTGN